MTINIEIIKSEYMQYYKGMFDEEGCAGTSAHSVALDLYCVEDTVLMPGKATLLPLGVRVEFPKCYYGLLIPRSSLPLKKGVGIPNGFGLIDTDYRGELKGMLFPLGNEPVEISAGERVFQLLPQVAAPAFGDLPEIDYYPLFRLVDSVDEDSSRGSGGFGSTGGYR